MPKGNLGMPRKSSKQKEIDLLIDQLEAVRSDKADLAGKLEASNQQFNILSDEKHKFSMQAAALNIENANLKKDLDGKIEVIQKQTGIITDLSQAINKMILRDGGE